MWDSYMCIHIFRGGVLAHCVDHDRPWMGGYLEARDPLMFKSLVRWTAKNDGFKGPAMMVALVIRNDADYSRGTHSTMNRYVARLRKLVRILEETGVDLDSLGPGYTTSYLSLYPEARVELKAALDALWAYRDHFHRVRDRVHELLYPVIRRNLETLTKLTVIYRVQEGYQYRVVLVHKAEANPYTLEYRVETELHLETPRKMSTKTLSPPAVEAFIDKLVERRRKNPLAARYTPLYDPWDQWETPRRLYRVVLGEGR